MNVKYSSNVGSCDLYLKVIVDECEYAVGLLSGAREFSLDSISRKIADKFGLDLEVQTFLERKKQRLESTPDS